MAKINALTDKGKSIYNQLTSVKEHLSDADIADHNLWLAVNSLCNAVENLVNDDQPCWEKVDTAEAPFDENDLEDF